MIVASSVPVLTGLGASDALSAEQSALLARSDALFRRVGQVKLYPLLGGGERRALQAIEDSLVTLHQDIELGARPLDTMPNQLSVIDREVTRHEASARRNTLLLAFGGAFVVGVGGYYIWKKT